ncbi:MAG TPA: hypothetical protein VF519_11210 [Mycobacteriales bacterium]|jgi:hypothetical protein
MKRTLLGLAALGAAFAFAAPASAHEICLVDWTDACIVGIDPDSIIRTGG